MNRRIPTIDEFIMENDSAFQLYEGKFNWDAKKLSAAWNKNQPDVEEPYEPASPEVTIWVILTNLLNLHKIEPVLDYVDEFSVVGKTNDRYIGAYSEYNQDGTVKMTFHMVKPENMESYEVDSAMDMDRGKNVYTVTLNYDPDHVNPRTFTKQIDKIFKKMLIL